jgi:hypothetical protein
MDERHPRDELTVEAFARMHGMSINNVHLILRADLQRPDHEKRLPGAYKLGEGRRGIWLIPRSTAEAFVRGNAGRPKTK